MKWALYRRVSTDEQAQRGTSLETQAEVMKRAIAKGDVVYKIYSDEGYSGGNINRPALTQLLMDAKAKKFGGVMVAKTDRLSRSIKDIVRIVLDELDGYDIIFRSCTEPYDTSNATGKMMFTMLGSFADFERTQIKDRSMAGRFKKVVNEGHWSGGISPFGYAIDNKKLIIDPVESEIVKKIYHWYITEGISTTRIAIRLNEMGIRSTTEKKYKRYKTSGLWHGEVVRRILGNPLYKGEFTYRGHKVAYPAIVTPELFAQAEEQRKRNYNSSPRNTKEPSLLRGLLVCKTCGRNFYGHIKKPERRWGSGYVYKAYVCLSKRPDPSPRSCGMPNIPMDKMDTLIKADIMALFNDPEKLRLAIQNKRDEATPDKVLLEVRHSQILKETAEVSKKMERNLELYLADLKGITKDMLDSKSIQLTSELDALKIELAEVEKEQAALQEIDQVLADITKEGKNLTKKMAGLSNEEWYKFFHKMFKHIAVTYDSAAGCHSYEARGYIDTKGLLEQGVVYIKGRTDRRILQPQPLRYCMMGRPERPCHGKTFIRR